MAQHIQASWDGNIAIHRYEDLALIRSVIREFAPARTIELGTAEGGFAAFLATTVIEWDGEVLSLDHRALDSNDAKRFTEMYDNLTIRIADILQPDGDTLAYLLYWLSEAPYVCLYTDNGNKQKELELYVPLLNHHALVGTHDYGTELNAGWAEAFMAAQRFRPYRHNEFAALANSEYYPDSLTRFWIRGDSNG